MSTFNEKDQLGRALMGSEHADKYVDPDKTYDSALKTDESYIDTLPDLQNGVNGLPKVKIEQVGIHNFRLPLKFMRRGEDPVELEAAISGSVSIDAHTRGINMSRILRTFYRHKDTPCFSLDYLKNILDDYRKDLNTLTARIQVKFSLPLQVSSLRSDNWGWQYYDVVLEGNMAEDGTFTKQIHLDFVYSSACPCSNELSEHARKFRNKAAIPHSQRSVARISVVYDDMIYIEDLIDHCREAMKTEVQVVVKREDEQAFAELNGCNVKFVEDAARQFHKVLASDSTIRDFRVILSHNESLHPHNAVAVITKGNGYYDDVVTFSEWQSLNK